MGSAKGGGVLAERGGGEDVRPPVADVQTLIGRPNRRTPPQVFMSPHRLGLPMSLDVGIVGTGFMGEMHAQAYVEMEDVTVTAVSTPSGPEAFVEEFGFDEAATFTDTAELLATADVDFLDVCTPTDTHLDVVRAATDAGVDVFLEKPIAGNIEEAREIERLADEAGVRLMVGHVLRFFPEYRAASDRDVGDPGVARARRLSPFPDWGSGDWYADRDRSGGVFLDLAIHDLDYLRWCWGDVEEVFARRHREPEAEHGFVTLRFANGAVGYVEASWAQPDSRELTSELELAGDGGVVAFDTTDPEPYHQWTDDAESVENSLRRDPYHRELAHFVDCLETDTVPDVTTSEAIEALKLSLAAQRSAEHGEPVAVEEVVA